VTINVIKYCNSIKIPEILIENKNEVDRARKKIFEEEIYSFLYVLRKILILIYVDKIHTNKNGISFGL
tara:strand:- start:221 stop:424 length:204 start_codon:yes stop_codon:yes gene_type:complete